MLINHDFKSPNFDHREIPIEYIIIHYTEMAFEDALQKLINKGSKVSAHYLIKADGQIFQLVDDNKIAWHAGKSCWKKQEKLNQNSIGIELDNLGVTKFTQQQISSCLELSKYLMQKHFIPKYNFIGHSDIAADRKIDPGIFFDWQFFAQHGLGIWHNLERSASSQLHQLGEEGAKIHSLQTKLDLLGYNIKMSYCQMLCMEKIRQHIFSHLSCHY